ncbi:hypothetical protein H9L39_19344 [Fusarium oxysporum f. sp. albedinis]|nr:hypothetical protein H9L39_19344 [Fusarium oxysporum f. sp. albedinis]
MGIHGNPGAVLSWRLTWFPDIFDIHGVDEPPQGDAGELPSQSAVGNVDRAFVHAPRRGTLKSPVS